MEDFLGIRFWREQLRTASEASQRPKQRFDEVKNQADYRE